MTEALQESKRLDEKEKALAKKEEDTRSDEEILKELNEAEDEKAKRFAKGGFSVKRHRGVGPIFVPSPDGRYGVMANSGDLIVSYIQKLADGTVRRSAFAVPDAAFIALTKLSTSSVRELPEDPGYALKNKRAGLKPSDKPESPELLDPTKPVLVGEKNVEVEDNRGEKSPGAHTKVPARQGGPEESSVAGSSNR